MDFQKLLSVANYNAEEGKLKASVKRYTTEFSPAKKAPKSNVQSNAIKTFLAKKQAEEQQKAIDAKQKKSELLALRAQSTKSNKKAKIMASRTKDNDFSRIKLSEDEVAAKKRREAELLRMSLGNTVERMKARIALEEKEKLLPKKRKRKSKHVDGSNKIIEEDHTEDQVLSKYQGHVTKDVKKAKPKPPPPPSMSYSELLKIASQKQAQPFAMPKIMKKTDQEERPLTKKEKRLLLEEENRLKRKFTTQATNAKSNSSITKPANVSKSSSGNPSSKQPMVVRVQKDPNANAPSLKSTKSAKDTAERLNKPVTQNQSQSKIRSDQVKALPAKKNPPKKAENKSSGSQDVSLNGDAIKTMLAEMEERIRKQVQEEFKAQFETKKVAEQTSAIRTSVQPKDKPVSVNNGQKITNKAAPSKVNSASMKKPIQKAPVERKPAFHPNPYLQPPRRLLESRRALKVVKRKIESDDDSEDDDMSDFIDDEPMHGFDEDYSKHIKEIFGYDRNKYMNDDDDDIIETSFAEQMKEECRSAKLGLAEDLEDIRREKEELKRKQIKKKNS